MYKIIILIIILIIVYILYNTNNTKCMSKYPHNKIKNKNPKNGKNLGNDIDCYINTQNDKKIHNLNIDNTSLLHDGNYHSWDMYNFVKKTYSGDIQGSSEKFMTRLAKNYPTNGNIISNNMYKSIYNRK